MISSPPFLQLFIIGHGRRIPGTVEFRFLLSAGCFNCQEESAKLMDLNRRTVTGNMTGRTLKDEVRKRLVENLD